MRFPASLTRVLPALAVAAVLVAVCTLTRIALALRPDTAALGAADLARSFAYGFAFDTVAAAYAVTPLVLWLALAPGRLARTRAYRLATLVGFGVACFATLLLAVAEWLFWDEFGARFNFIAVDYYDQGGLIPAVRRLNAQQVKRVRRERQLAAAED